MTAISVSNILVELGRRGMYRAATAYCVTAWAVAKIAELMLQKFGAPDWALQVVLVVLLIGFPVVMSIAWVTGLGALQAGVLEALDGDGEAGTEQGGEIREVDVGPSAAGSSSGSSQGRLSSGKLWTVVGGLGLAGVLAWWATGIGGNALEIERIAVLPPENLTGQADADYFVMGMHDALISRLGETLGEQADVIGRRSVQRYAQSEMTVGEIAAELDVDALVESIVLKSRDGAVINARLTLGNPERQVWTGSYTQELDDIGSLYTEVATAIAGEISDAILPTAAEKAVDPAAYDAYLLGKHYRNRLQEVEGDLRRAAGYFETAIDIDKNFYKAHAGLAETWSDLGWANTVAPQIAWPKLEASANTANELMPDDPDVRVSSALLKQFYRWDAAGADRDFSKAISLNPNHVGALLGRARLLSILGRHEEALEHAARAASLEPGDPFVEVQIVWSLAYAGNFDEANAALDEILERFPGFGFARWFQCFIFTNQGRYAEAIASMEAAISQLAPDDLGDEYALLGYLHAKEGRADRAQEYLELMTEQENSGRYISPVARAYVHLGLGNYDTAVELIEEGVNTRTGWIAILPLFHYWYEPLRDRPDFRRIMDTVGLPY